MKRSEAALGDTAIITLIAACIPEISPALPKAPGMTVFLCFEQGGKHRRGSDFQQIPNAHRSSFKEKDKLFDHASRLFSIGAVSLPTFWVALFFQLIFYKLLNWLPIGGEISIMATVFGNKPHITGMLLFDCMLTGNWAMFADAFRHILLPGITVALYPIGLVSRMTRSALLEILNEDYITAGRSYGIREVRMLWKYALKNALGTTATDVALSMGYTLTDTFLVEAIFSWPGIGSYISNSITTMDYPAIIGSTLFGAISYIILNLLADIIIASDPRVRL